MSAKTMNAVSWDEASTVKLINAYKQQSVLWNIEHRGHQNRCTRNDAWLAIANTMQCDLREVKRKMNSLIAVFRSQHRKGVTNPRWWSGHMSFLLGMEQASDTSVMQPIMMGSIPVNHVYTENSICSISDDLEDASECEFLDADSKKRPFQSAFQEFRAVFEADSPSKRAANEVQPAVVSSSGLQIVSVGVDTGSANDLVNSSSNMNNNSNHSNHSNHSGNIHQLLHNTDEPSDAESEGMDAATKLDIEEDTDIFIKFLACKIKKYSPRTLSLVQYHFTRVLYEADMGILVRPADIASK